ncbi:hypothetical protein OG298_35215 [Streptomyces sp. NBC_01005]|nr:MULTISPECIES: hypothetical protein [unclassified Streptomyces]WSW09207.1 hypothetical protein OG298_35215 [Streptomyces sp. NBC_01005]WTB52946.1 hypothetical protein OG832_07095 [Streptomyces sp. NBC_00826]WTH94163.1 hypothetical protein OIC43_36595 [Streptomyces sp. NBC_00825]WTI02898.1 hypothetical protein OHA23_36575 [Streptomyces sp. NBC_00822]MCX4899792.1 hypothetical protein [Streptomyces sp. NBC_00892]
MFVFRCRARVEGHRAVATRCSGLAVRYKDSVLVAAINEWW